MNCMNYSDAELLRYISSGIVSKGLYLQNDLINSISPKYNLVKLPDDVEFSLPSIPETTETFELLNQDISEQFKSVLNNGGRSLAIRFLSGIASFFSEKREDIEKLNDSSDPYFKKWSQRELLISTSVPMASLHIENTNQCTLSVQAMKRLQMLEMCFQRKGLNYEFISQCEKFFMEFGSHYFIGTYHLGGFRKDSRTEKAEETQDGGPKKKHDYYSTMNINYEKSGGSAADDDICAWKRSFIGKPLQWFVIDKEESSAMNYRAVWNLIDSIPRVQHKYKFIDALQQAWRITTGLNINPEIDGTAFILENKMKDIEKKVERDIFLLKFTKNCSIQKGRKTTVSDMINRERNNELFGKGIRKRYKAENETSSYKTEEEFEKITARLYEEYLTEIDTTGDVQDSIDKLLERNIIKTIIETPNIEVSGPNSGWRRNFTYSESQENPIDSSEDEEYTNWGPENKFPCHPNCKKCSNCAHCPTCCMEEGSVLKTVL